MRQGSNAEIGHLKVLRQTPEPQTQQGWTPGQLDSWTAGQLNFTVKV